MKFWLKGLTLFLAVVAASLGLSATESQAQTTQVNLGVTFRNARLASLWIAEEEGYFKKQGIDLKTMNISGGSQGVQTIVSGGVDVSFDDPISAIVATAAGVPVVDVFAGTPTMPFLLVGAPGVKTLADLKGKRVGSSGLGPSASRLALLVAFRKLGLDVEKDQITVVASGQEPERMAGLASGAIAATVISPEYRSRLEQLGITILADLRTMNIPWETASLLTTRKNMQSKRDAVEHVIKALLEGNAYILNAANRARVLELLVARLGLKNSQEAAGPYDDLVKYYVLKKPYPNRAGITNILAELIKVVPKSDSLKYEDVTDASIVEKLDKSGFIDGLYK
jgi:ABC-type nitrate/sulfonate/bicarbonate transport system substrate-binding protein